MKFDWRYALDKILIFLTSTKNLVIVAGVLLSLFGLELTTEVQAYVISGAAIVLSVLKLLDSILDKTEAPV